MFHKIQKVSESFNLIILLKLCKITVHRITTRDQKKKETKKSQPRHQIC